MSGRATHQILGGPGGLPDDLYRRLIEERQSFWSVVYAPFISRDLTREDLRALLPEICTGLRSFDDLRKHDLVAHRAVDGAGLRDLLGCGVDVTKIGMPVAAAGRS